MEIVSLPNPHPQKGQVLVRTYFSAISTGTEGKTVTDARKGYFAKAQSRKEEVSKVLKAAQNFGVSDTYKMVMNKLESLQPLGYSLSGEVVEVGEGVTEFQPGDRVACGGATASHAELVVVPKNLVVKLRPKTAMDQAAFTTIGAIALQGIRRSGLSIGENAAVIGLGLIGQITVKLLKAAGIRAFGIDLKPELVDQAIQSGAEGAALRSDTLLEARVAEFARGEGVDAVIITAGSSSLDPVELAGKLCRTHGKVIIVGSVPTGFSRKNYYRKELELLMSTSYGPGRYDSNYEEKGLDYPIGQVRWTENRNMQAFSGMLTDGSIYLNDLISHRFDFDDARRAFDLVVNPEEEKMGILLAYDTDKPLSAPSKGKKQTASGNRISVIGAGSFSGNFLMPNLAKHMEMGGVLTARPHTAENAARKFGFQKAFANADELFDADGAAAVAIATRHDSHATYALQALEKGKRVFLEKPMCIHKSEFLALRSLLLQPEYPDLMVGFNRRFAPHTQKVKKVLSGVPVSIQYRVNAGNMPADHWVHDPEVGGGRIIGEVCHFIDLCAFFAESQVASVMAVALDASIQQNDTCAITLKMENGSIANISYFSNGSPKLPKEHIEIFAGGSSAVIQDFKTLELADKNGMRKTKLQKQDKGHAAEIEAFASAVKSGKALPVSVEESLHATLVTFAVVESLRRGGEKIDMKDFEASWISPKAN